MTVPRICWFWWKTMKPSRSFWGVKLHCNETTVHEGVCNVRFMWIMWKVNEI